MTTVMKDALRDSELDRLNRALDEARETLRAIRSGDVDALVMSTAEGDRLFTLTGADRPYRRFVEAMAEGSLVVSAAGVILSSNARMAQMTERPSEELAGSRLSAIFAGDAAAVLLQPGSDEVAPSPIDSVLQTASGGALPVSVSSSAMDLDGLLVTCLLVTDVSERQRIQEAHRFQAQLLDAAGEAIIVTDAQGVVTYVNRAAEALYGRTAADFLGRPITETTPSDTSAQQGLEIMNRLLAGDTWAGEFMVRRRDGTEFPAFVHDTPVFDEAGGLRAIIGISTDITERKTAEAQLATRERWFRTLVSSSSDFIIVSDADGLVTFANKAITTFLGFDPAKRGGPHPFGLLHPGDLERARAQWEAIRNAPGSRKQTTVRVKNADGAWRFVDANLVNCLDDPAIKGVVTNARDVTDNRRLDRALRAVSRVNELIIHATDEVALLCDACAALVEFGDYTLAWIGRADRDADAIIRRVAAAGDQRILDATVISAADSALGQGISGRAIRTRSPQVMNAFTARRFRPWREAIATYHIASGCSFPLELDDETLSLSVYTSEENVFDASTVAVFQQLADDLVFGIGRLRSAQRLAESELNLRDAERLAHVGHWAWDLATDRFELLAVEAFALHGITPDDWGHTYDAFLELVHPEDRCMVEDAFARARESGAAEVRHRIVRPGGEVRHVVKNIEAIRDRDGRVTRFAGTIMDVTELEMVAVAREEARGSVVAITDNMAEGMLALDANGAISFVNESGGRLLGWPHGDLIGLPGHETYHSRRADGSPNPVEDCSLEKVRTTAESVHAEHDTFVRRDGTLLPVSYSASALGSNGTHGVVIVFDDITDRVAERMRVQQELDKLAWVGRVRDALDQDRFVLYAQPIIDLQSGEPIQHELLIRMIGTDGAIIPPIQFLPAAEEFGLITEIDRWVVRETARIAALGIPVEFNLSAKSVMNPKMVSIIADALKAAGAAPEDVVCEITETVLMTDAAAGEAFVRGLNAIGCKVALDDFGVGYGGFSYLKRLPVSTLKIDREFVADVVTEESSRNVVAAVVSLARAFSAKTVAEGAEDMATVEILKELGVDAVQGYVYGRPEPLDEAFSSWLNAPATSMERGTVRGRASPPRRTDGSA